ncbi:hypothetical protein CDD82_5207 [Ophiocordyceps australis]|uniref:CENP-V/GFA domain-containing protein n=1 Tax=Ophiocordyceps australis TaxID=1399860 RepID=A0A2C5ZNL5_9HYPO|nr:hypothetical protein CDD82_5207 [Ophiocordyceps australis]
MTRRRRFCPLLLPSSKTHTWHAHRPAGTPKTWASPAASGKTNKRFFCGDCSSGLWSELEVMPESLCLKAGCLDDGAASMGGKVGVELYTKDRVAYLPALEGAKQVEAFGRLSGGS